MDKPFSAACERNREPILAVLRDHVGACRTALEIGSGTGQHAVHFAAALPHLHWQTSDLAESHEGMKLWLEEAALPNVSPPLTLDVRGDWPAQRYDLVFTANTFHIMAWEEVELFFQRLPSVLTSRALLIVYGPFNYNGQFTSEGNAKFQQTLKGWGAHMGIRDFEAVNVLALNAGLQLVDDRAMPANNRCLVWRRNAQG